MFCPALGIPEDPVSGNAHGLLGAYLAEQGLLPHRDHRAVHRRAGPPRARAGRVDVELEFTQGKLDGVWIVGQAVEIFETEMTL
jgi:PhzF family phenazine biosynthesis protein